LAYARGGEVKKNKKGFIENGKSSELSLAGGMFSFNECVTFD
jgi:hypothetical protein